MVTDLRTEHPTDGPTDTRSYRVASSRLKIREQNEEGEKNKEEEQRDSEVSPLTMPKKKNGTCYVRST